MSEWLVARVQLLLPEGTARLILPVLFVLVSIVHHLRLFHRISQRLVADIARITLIVSHSLFDTANLRAPPPLSCADTRARRRIQMYTSTTHVHVAVLADW